jgi:hypothetical protein
MLVRPARWAQPSQNSAAVSRLAPAVASAISVIAAPPAGLAAAKAASGTARRRTIGASAAVAAAFGLNILRLICPSLLRSSEPSGVMHAGLLHQTM